MKKIIVLIVFLSYFYVPMANAEIPFFFDGPRSMGMGGAFTAVADDENAIQYNPAGLAQITKSSMTISGSLMDYTWGYDLGESLSLNYNYLNADGAISYVQKNFGARIHYKTTGNKNWRNMGDIQKVDLDQEIQLIAAFGIDITPGFKFGLNTKFNYLDNVVYKLSWDNKCSMAFDAGFICNLTKDISMGLTLQNVITVGNVDYFIRDDYGEVITAHDLPYLWNIGISYQVFSNLLCSFDIKNLLEYSVPGVSQYYMLTDIPPEYVFKRSYHIGLEYLALDNLSIRIGSFVDESIPKNPITYTSGKYGREIDCEKRITVTAGVGYKIGDFKIDAAIINGFRKINDVNVPKYLLSVSYVFNEDNKK